jgi:hypothetical protein
MLIDKLTRGLKNCFLKSLDNVLMIKFIHSQYFVIQAALPAFVSAFNNPKSITL